MGCGVSIESEAPQSRTTAVAQFVSEPNGQEYSVVGSR
jgi:hypothetical protein